MTSVQNPTYLLAPNWTFRPGGPIALGNISTDPFRPHRSLSKPSKPLPETETATENNWRLATERVRYINVSIWTRLLQQLNLQLGAQSRKAESGSFVMTSLETVYFKDEPPIEDLRERLNEPRIRNIMKPDSLFRSPVYMVTGLKIAKGFQLTHDRSSERSLIAKASGAVAVDVSVGGQVEVATRTSRSDGFEAAQDIIFAYQLLRIKQKGWGEGITLDTEEFRNKAAFLGDDAEEEEEEEYIDLESGTVTLDELAESLEGTTVVPLGDRPCTWLFQSD